MPLGSHLGNTSGQLFWTNKTRLLSKWMGRESNFHWSPGPNKCMYRNSRKIW